MATVKEVKLMKDGAMVTPVVLADSVKNLDGTKFKDHNHDGRYYTESEVDAKINVCKNEFTINHTFSFNVDTLTIDNSWKSSFNVDISSALADVPLGAVCKLVITANITRTKSNSFTCNFIESQHTVFNLGCELVSKSSSMSNGGVGRSSDIIVGKNSMIANVYAGSNGKTNATFAVNLYVMKLF